MSSIVRGRTDWQKTEDDDIPFMCNSRGDGIVVQGLPERSELIRMGHSFSAFCPTAVAPVAAPPTTATIWTIQNGEAAAAPFQRCYLIDTVCAITTTSAGAAQNLGPLVIMMNGAAASLTGTDTLTPVNLSGSSNGSKILTKTASAVTATTAIYEGPTVVCANTATLGLSVTANVYGRYLLRPTCLMGFHVMCNAAGAAVCKIQITWHEVDLILG